MKQAETEAKLTKHDREIDAIRSLIRTGMRLIVRIEQAQLQNEHAKLQNDRQIAELRASQKETGQQIQSLLKAIERGRNGKERP